MNPANTACPRCGAMRIGGRCLACFRRSTDLARAAHLQRKARRKRKKPAAKRGADRVAGIELAPWMRHMAGLPVLGGSASRLTDNLPRLHVRRASKKPTRRLAFADYERHLLHLTDYPGITPPDALETLLHEVVHLSSLKLRKHDNRFKTTLAQAAFECFGVDCRGQTRLAVYRLDCAIVDALHARAGDFATPPLLQGANETHADPA